MADMARIQSVAPRLLGLLVLAGLLMITAAATARAQGGAATVDVVTIGGPIDSTMVGYLQDALDTAAAQSVEVVVVQLDSPGLLNVTLEEVLTPLRQRQVPVVFYIGPPGAVATGAAAWLAASGDVVAVAPGTVFGAAELDGSTADPASGAARERLESAGLMSAAVIPVRDPQTVLPEGTSLPRDLEAGDIRLRTTAELIADGVADVTGLTLQEALGELDGMAVGDGGEERLLEVDPSTANVRFNNQGLWGRILHSAANPALTYLLLVAGLTAIAFEFFQPGFGVAGMSGVFMVALAGYGLTVLPTRPMMAVLVVAGVALLSVDLAVGGFGLVTVAGTTALAVGSVRLFGGDAALPGWLSAGVVAFAVVFFVGIMTTVLRAQGAQARAGADRVTGKRAIVRSMLNPEGHVFVDGALWRARAPEDAGKVKTGTEVRIVGTSDGLTLDVQLSDDSERAPAA